MTKHDLPFLPQFFDRYIEYANDSTLLAQLEESLKTLQDFELAPLEQLGDYVYEQGKWTVRDIFQHIIDTERIMAYRALRMARHDKTDLPGFEENDFAQNTQANTRTLRDLRDEWMVVRHSSVLLFRSLDSDALLQVGTASAQKITPLALGFVILGHPMHHFKVIQEKYTVGQLR